MLIILLILSGTGQMKKCINIGIGGVHASSTPVVIKTLLGSCVAVCLFDQVARVGGMNHIFLPGKADTRNFNTSCRFGINAMELLINRIMRLGGKRNRLAAKAFGGAHLLPSISEENGVGRRNAEFVREFLRIERIRIVSGDLGGTDARKIHFHTDTGNVFLSRVKKTMLKGIARKEKELVRRVEKDMKRPGEIDIF